MASPKFIIDSDNGISGSLTNLADGSSYLIAGNGIDIVSQSNGSVVINSNGNILEDQVLCKSSDQIVSGTTLTNDSELSISAPANSVWSISCCIFTTTIIHNESIWSLDVPAGTSLKAIVKAGSPSNTFSPAFKLMFTPGTYVQIGGPSGDTFAVDIEATVFVSSTMGNISLQYAEAANSTGLTVYKGSSMRATRIS